MGSCCWRTSGSSWLNYLYISPSVWSRRSRHGLLQNRNHKKETIMYWFKKWPGEKLYSWRGYFALTMCVSSHIHTAESTGAGLFCRGPSWKRNKCPLLLQRLVNLSKGKRWHMQAKILQLYPVRTGKICSPFVSYGLTKLNFFPDLNISVPKAYYRLFETENFTYFVRKMILS